MRHIFDLVSYRFMSSGINSFSQEFANEEKVRKVVVGY